VAYRGGGILGLNRALLVLDDVSFLESNVDYGISLNTLFILFLVDIGEVVYYSVLCVL